MHEPYDSYEFLSMQDYGPYVDSVELFEINGKWYLEEACGYSDPYTRNWYELSEKPRVKLAKVYKRYTNGLFCCDEGGDASIIEELLHVGAKVCEDPT